MSSSKRGSPGDRRDLAAALKRAGSAAALARELGVSSSSVRRWIQSYPPARREQVRSWLVAQRQKPRKRAPTRKRVLASLAKEVKRAGSAAALARELGVSPSSVRRGLKDGPSSYLLSALERAKARKKAAKPERDKFAELLESARKRIPIVITSEGTREGPLTSGVYWSKSIRRQLSEAMVDEALNWMASLERKGPFEYWQAIAEIVQFDPTSGKNTPFGYKQGILQVNPKSMGDYVVASKIATTRSDFDSVSVQLGEKLYETLDEFYVFMTGLTVYNYNLRTEEERRQWETAQRKKRGGKRRRKKGL